MERRVKELCEKGGIKLLLNASREETLSAIKSSKVLAMPSKHETFGIVGLEAMALGKPVVVYEEAGGPLDYIKHGKNGLVVDSYPASLNGGCSALIKDDKFRKELSNNAVKTAQGHGWGAVAEKIENFYSSVLHK
jgi:glycosyltransferase involved in cell wall biosynthesis